MNDLTDSELLRDYEEKRSEGAFAELVRRHVDFVYSAALRMVRNDSHLAQDVTQGVFVALAKNASQLIDHKVLSGWLHRTAQNIAAQAIRTEVRRRAREQESVAMNELLTHESDVAWENIAPHLDTALSELSEPDRDALLLRYFERKSAREMAVTLNVSEEAAQKRVNRAVERLREIFTKRNVTVGASGLVVLISANAVQAAPIGLFATISTAAVLAGTAVQTSTAIVATKTIAMTILQKTIVAATLVAAISTPLILQHREIARLRKINAAMQTAQSAGLQKPSTANATPNQVFGWQQVESQDYLKYIANLRGSGCPEATIRDIIVADVNQLYESRGLRTKAVPQGKYEYWRSVDSFSAQVSDVEGQRQLDRVRRRVIKELLGVEAEPLPVAANIDFPREVKLAFLSQEKQERTADVENEFIVRLAKLFGRGGEIDPVKYRTTLAEKEAALAKILSPQELLEYNLRMSQTAHEMRQQLGEFEPTEAEFRALFTIRKEFSDRYAYGFWSRDPKEKQDLLKATLERENQFKQIFGGERYAEYARSQDMTYLDLLKVADGEGLPKITATQIYDMIRNSREQRTQDWNDAALSPTEKRARSTALASKTEQAIKKKLGQAGWESFKRLPGSQTLDSMNPTPNMLSGQ